jgi:hypothetical protein
VHIVIVTDRVTKPSISCHVEALVDPGHQQRLRPLGLGTDLARLARLHLVRVDQLGKNTERGLRERLSPRGPPADHAHAHVRLDLEGLPARAHPRSPNRD